MYFSCSFMMQCVVEYAIEKLNTYNSGKLLKYIERLYINSNVTSITIPWIKKIPWWGQGIIIFAKRSKDPLILLCFVN